MTRKRVSEALDYYLEELRKQFPDARMEVMSEPMGGFDVGVRIEAPAGEVFNVLDATAGLTPQCFEKYKVNVLAIVNGQTEPVPPTGELRRP